MVEKIVTLQDMVKINDYLWEIPQTFRTDMRVPARIYMTENMIDDIKDDRSLLQLVNVATLPGIAKFALAMPDVHQGYGFPIGGVAATIIDEGGVISPGGIGYDINCGIRLLAANRDEKDIKPQLEKLATALFHAVPSGVGKGGKLKLDYSELDRVLKDGAHYMVKLGYGTERDLEFCEETGRMDAANPDLVSKRAKQRGLDQLGTLGSGNHFLEVQVVDQIFDERVAKAFGLHENQVVVMIHCGSRGLGHQVCTDQVKIMMSKIMQWGYVLPDRELVCAPFVSQEGQNYYAAMAAAANFAWANRHVIAHWTREAFKTVLGQDVDLDLVYDVSHNIGKVETHSINGKDLKVVMHRKGATRSFGPHTQGIPKAYEQVGQPVLIPGTMGTSSYILTGDERGMEQSFGSCCHGAGRRLSRSKAKKIVQGPELRRQLEKQGIVIRCDADRGLVEEAPIAYKDVDNVVNVITDAGIAKRVARVRPLAVIKGG